MDESKSITFVMEVERLLLRFVPDQAATRQLKYRIVSISSAEQAKRHADLLAQNRGNWTDCKTPPCPLRAKSRPQLTYSPFSRMTDPATLRGTGSDSKPKFSRGKKCAAARQLGGSARPRRRESYDSLVADYLRRTAIVFCGRSRLCYPMIALTSRYSSKPKTPNSRPLPDCLYPPNGRLRSNAAPLR